MTVAPEEVLGLADGVRKAFSRRKNIEITKQPKLRMAVVPCVVSGGKIRMAYIAKKTACYIRISLIHDEVAFVADVKAGIEKLGISPSKVRLYKENGEVKQDRGVAFLRLVSDIKKGRISKLIVWSWSQVAGGEYALLWMFRTCWKAGTELISIKEPELTFENLAEFMSTVISESCTLAYRNGTHKPKQPKVTVSL